MDLISGYVSICVYSNTLKPFSRTQSLFHSLWRCFMCCLHLLAKIGGIFWLRLNNCGSYQNAITAKASALIIQQRCASTAAHHFRFVMYVFVCVCVGWFLWSLKSLRISLSKVATLPYNNIRREKNEWKLEKSRWQKSTLHITTHTLKCILYANMNSLS